MLLEDILSPFEKIGWDLEEYLKEIEGFWFLGTTPVGNRVLDIVAFLPLEDGRYVSFPLPVQDFPQGLWVDTRRSKEVLWRKVTDKKIEILNPEELPVIGDRVYFYIPEVVFVSDNIYRFWGRLLAPEYYSVDNFDYLSFLEAVLGFFVLGPTEQAVKTLLPNSGDYFSSPEWFNNTLLPPNLVQVKPYPILGKDTYEGDTVLPSSNLLENPAFLFRYSKDFGIRYFDEEPPLYFGRFGDGKVDYVFDGKTPGYLLIDTYLKYSLISIDVSSFVSPDPKETFKRLEILKKGRPIGSGFALFYKANLGFNDSEGEFSLDFQQEYKLQAELKKEDSVGEVPYFDETDLTFDSKEPPLPPSAQPKVGALYFDRSPVLFDLGIFAHYYSNTVIPASFRYTFNSKDLFFDKNNAHFYGEVPPNSTIYGGKGMAYFDMSNRSPEGEVCYGFDIKLPRWCDLGYSVVPYVHAEEDAHFYFLSELSVMEIHHPQEVSLVQLQK
jgi:hypothetical protein